MANKKYRISFTVILDEDVSNHPSIWVPDIITQSLDGDEVAYAFEFVEVTDEEVTV